MRARLSPEEKAWIENPADAGVPIEILHRTFYDYKNIVGAVDGSVSVSSSYSFFNTPSGTPVGSTVNTKESSNIPKPLSIGSPYKFLIQEVAFVVMPYGRGYITGSSATADKTFAADAMEILTRGVLTMKVLGVDQVEIAPLMALPSGMSADFSAQIADTSAGRQANANGWGVLSNRYPVSVFLFKDTSFDCLLDYPMGTFKIYNNIRFGVLFDGLLQRPRSK